MHLGALCMQPRTPVSFLSFLGPEGRPQNGGFFHLIDWPKIADFLHNKLFFLIAPRDLHYYWASAQPCADRLRKSTKKARYVRSLGKKPHFGAFPEAQKGVLICAICLRKAAHWPNNNANPSGLSEKTVYCVESLRFFR